MRSGMKAVGKLGICCIAVALLFILNPFQMNVNHRLVFSGLILAILLWSVEVCAKRYVAAFLVVLFLLFGESEVTEVFRFPLSPDFVLIVFSFLFSQGIVHANLADLFSEAVIKRVGTSPLKLVLLGIVCSMVLIFVIPQPFARVILLAAVYQEYFKKNQTDKRIAETVLFSLFVFATTSYMLFRNGDIILNTAAISFAGVEISATQWIQMMFVPSFLTGGLIFAAFLFVFRKELFGIPFHVKQEKRIPEISPIAKRTLLIIGIVVVLWITEGYHGIGADIVIVGGTLAMYGTGVVKREDLKHINIDLICFLTAAFAIGPVMKNTGIANQVFASFSGLFPAEFSYQTFLVIVLGTMLLHMVLGSTITTLSVVLPGFLSLTTGLVSPTILMFTAYIAVNIHYLLPFHHVTVMIGSGKQYYANKTVLEFGICLTVITLFSIMMIYYPYWKAIGMI